MWGKWEGFGEGAVTSNNCLLSLGAMVYADRGRGRIEDTFDWVVLVTHVH